MATQAAFTTWFGGGSGGGGGGGGGELDNRRALYNWRNAVGGDDMLYH